MQSYHTSPECHQTHPARPRTSARFAIRQEIACQYCSAKMITSQLRQAWAGVQACKQLQRAACTAYNEKPSTMDLRKQCQTLSYGVKRKNVISTEFLQCAGCSLSERNSAAPTHRVHRPFRGHRSAVLQAHSNAYNTSGSSCLSAATHRCDFSATAYLHTKP